MADAAPSDDHLFDDAPQGIGPSPAGAAAAQAIASQAQPQPHPLLTPGATPDDDHLFDDAPQGMRDSSAAGSFARGVGLGAAPSVGGLAGAGVGATAGAALGEAVFPAGGGIVGGIAGGLAGAFGGGAAVQKGQDWLISKLPQSWQDKLNEQEQSDTAQHPIAQFMGGLAPFAVTMSPTSAVSELPENATNLMKLMANPVTQRMFSGAVMGGTELGNEYASGQGPNWAKVGIATGAGMIFSRPNAIGERILAAPFGGIARDSATLVQAGDAKVMGPGVTEEVFHGEEQQAPLIEMQAQQAARDEKMALEGPPQPDPRELARKAEPELFAHYDALQEQADSARQFIDNMNAPPQGQYDALSERFNALNDSLDAEKNQVEQRRIRAQMREVGNQWAALDERKAAFEAGQGQDTPEMTAARQRIQEANQGLWDMHGDIQAAYLRAAESSGSETHTEPETVAPEQTPSVPEAAATAGEAQPPEAPPQPIQSREDIKNDIVQHITDQLKGTKYSDQQINDFALVNAALYDTLAARTGGNALDLYNKYGPTWNTKGVQAHARPNVLELTQRGSGREYSQMDYPLAPRSEWYGESNYQSTGGRLVSMTPDEFLAHARPLEIDESSRDNIEDLKNHIRSGRTLDPLALYKNGKEDGRHRANAAKELGIEQVPVLNFRNARPNVFELTQRAQESGREFNQLSDETPEERALTVNDILSPSTPSLPARSRNVEDIAKDLMTRGASALKGLGVRGGRIEGPEPKTDEHISRAIASEIQQALGRGGRTASDWYTHKVREAMSVASAIHPEVGTDENARSAFTAALAITSQGETVPSNVRLADQIYSSFKETGRFPTEVSAKNGPAMAANFRKLNALIDERGLAGMKEFLSTEFTVKELEKLGYDVGGENKGTSVYGSAILGPKIGQGFYQNLNGNYNPVTMDLWFMRAWGRLTGTLVGKTDISKPRARLEAALAAEGKKVPKTIPGLEKVADEISTAHERDFIKNRAQYNSGEKSKSELTNAAVRFVFNKNGINETPTSGSQRGWMRDRVARAREILAQDQGINVTPADLQAIWWYPEKELYAKLGGRDSEGINVDYASALRDLARKKGVSDDAVDTAVRALDNGPRSSGEGAVGGAEPSGGEGGVRPHGSEEGRELLQQAKGKVRFVAGKRPIATLFRDADFSTLIHEGVGHPLLEMMGELAEHPDAPPDIRDDWQTVKDWLGVKDREDIQTRQHEKFARGFEQYVREGVAPSPGLARTFSRIKQWMTAIYQTLKGLGKPINDDIRQVFDRLLAEEPHPTVIMPESEHGPTLADIHEADAKITHPKDADAVGDRVVAERDRAIQEHEPEIAQALAGEEQRIDAEAAQRAGQTGAGAGGHGEVGVDSGESEYQPRSGTLGEAGGAEQRGGSAAVSKSGGLAGSESGGSGGESAGGRNASEGSRNAMAPAAAPRLESRNPSGLTDKAGNIRLENLTDDADARRAIRESAQENDDFLGDRRGIVTDQQVDDLATALGMNQSLLLKRRIGQAFNAEQIIAARRLLIQSATHVSDLMKKAATGTDADVMAYAEGRSRHQMIQGVVSGVTAEAGRALRAFRNIAGSQEAMQVDQFLRDATGKTLFQMKEEAKLGAQLGTPEAVSSFVDKAGKPTFGRMVLEYWINGLISGIPTHVTYTVGNFLLAGERTLLETPAAASIGAIRTAMGREGNVIPFGETAAKIRGAIKGIPVGMEAAAQAARTGNTTLLPGETPKGAFALQYGGALNEAATYGDAMKAWYGIGRGLWDGALSAGQLVAAGGDPSAPFIASTASRGYIPNLAVKGVPLPVGEVLRAPGRMIATIHSFFRALNYSIEMNGNEFQRAWNEGHRGDDLAQRVADLRLNRNPDDMEAARGEATQATLMGEGGKFTKSVSSLLNSEFNLGPLGPTPILKFIDPFVHISSNIINQAIVQRTPLGILAPSIRADLMGKNGSIAADKAAARMLVGSALAMTFGMLAANGFVTGAGPQDRNKAAMWKAVGGYQAHSVRINDTWYDLHRLGPLGMLLGMAADLYGIAGVAQKDDFATAAGAFQHAITQSVLDESFMRGPSELLKALEDKSYAPIYVRNFVSSFVPFSVGMSYEARAMDPYQRQTRTIMDAIKAKIPGQSETLWPRIDAWGNPMPTQEALGGNAVTALWMNKISSDPVNQEMVRLGIGKPPVPRSIRNQTMTDSQYDEFARLAGKMTKSNLDRIVNSSQWRAIPDSGKTQIVDEIFRQSREGARGLMMARHPEIANGAVQQKLMRRTGANIRPLQ